MADVVVDASIVLAWALDDERSDYANGVIASAKGGDIVVPGHWRLEVTNGLLLAERRKRMPPSDIPRYVSLVNAIEVIVDQRTGEVVTGSTLQLARRHSLTIYDAAYLELTLRVGLSLATLDTRLASACKSEGGTLA